MFTLISGISPFWVKSPIPRPVNFLDERVIRIFIPITPMPLRQYSSIGIPYQVSGPMANDEPRQRAHSPRFAWSPTPSGRCPFSPQLVVAKRNMGTRPRRVGCSSVAKKNPVSGAAGSFNWGYDFIWRRGGDSRDESTCRSGHEKLGSSLKVETKRWLTGSKQQTVGINQDSSRVPNSA